MAYIQILVIALALSYFALWRFNILLAGVAMASWVGFLFYHVNNPPAGVTAGDTAHTYIIWAIGGIIAAIPILTIARMRGRDTSRNIGSIEGDAIASGNTESSTLSRMSTADYQKYIRNRMRRRR